ncbi:glycosyltransferase 87 family protein [Colwellia psychrerythraea]|uniref:DUF2029 domain-containing protein n=1 Tax=Colwellia psychrerythraea TaxID=28229 RepID=A0A099KVF2_COLPS|nr:glycosyltransferase 87 family protein [Colwellia psychrerythraea]KGJ93852.1 hypothetical protein GAB14E_2407 [Colwellia psychrerythraea]
MKVTSGPANMWQRHVNSGFYFSCLVVYLLLCLSSHVLTKPSLTADSLGFYLIAQFSLMSLLMLIIWRLSANSNNVKDFRLLIFFAILVRLVLIGVDPYSSNDVDRYLFDGKIALAGFDPYRISHDAIALTDLREQWQPPVEHVKYVTLYPPLALALFSLAASAGVEYATQAWQIMLTLASLASLAIGILVLKRANKLKFLTLIALSPMLILESGMALHIDTFSTLAIMLMLYAWQRQHLVLTGMAIGLGTLIKILPLVLLLPLSLACIVSAYKKYQHLHQNEHQSQQGQLPAQLTNQLMFSLRGAFQLCFSTISVVIVGYLSAFLLGFHPIGSISVFFNKWRFGAPLFSFFEDTLTTAELLMISGVIATLVIAIICYLSISSQQNTSVRNSTNSHDNASLTTNLVVTGLLPIRLVIALQLALALPLLLSPVLFPWYLMPLVPLIALQPNFYGLAWLVIIPLTYEVMNQFHCCHIWAPAQWPLYLLASLYVLTLFHGLSLLISSKNSTKNLAVNSNIRNGITKQDNNAEVNNV